MRLLRADSLIRGCRREASLTNEVGALHETAGVDVFESQRPRF
jgi:hypothetical protein